MVVCCSAGGWFGRFRGQWFGRFLRQLQLVFMDSKGDGKHSVLALRRLVWTLSWPVVWTLSFFMDSKGDGRHFWNVLFSGRLDPVYKVVCCSLRVFCLAWARILLVFRSFRIWRLDAFLASGLDAFLASYTCFLWIPKVTGGIFETFCFPVVLALCLWWFAVAQAAGLDVACAIRWLESCCSLFRVFWPVTLVFYGFQRWREAFLKRSVFRSSWPCVYGGLL